jgi:cell wall assembly regulator SMI1
MSDELLAEFRAAEPASEWDVEAAEAGLGIRLPTDFRKFLLTRGGGEGFIGEHYLIAWSASELVELNEAYQVKMHAPGLILIGSDGGGEGFAFDTRNGQFNIVQVPFIGMCFEDARLVANSFTGLLERMKSVNGSLF